MNGLNFLAPPTVGQFMSSSAFTRVMIGPVGSGKSTGCIVELLRRATEQAPDSQGVRKTRFAVVRNTLQQLRQTCLADIQQLLTPIVNYRVTDATVQVRFTDPQYGKIESDWMLIPLDTKEDQQRLLSLNLTGAWVSEFREIPLSIIDALAGRVGRYPSRAIVAPTWYGIIGESNPPDEDSDWYKKLELEPPPNWAIFHQPGGMEPNAENRENLPPNYYETLVANNTPDWVDVHVHAKYGKSLSGQAVFRASFDPGFHVTYEELRPNPLYPLIIGHDFGRTPAALVGQVDHQGRLLVLAEATSQDMGLEQFGTIVLRPLLLTSRFNGLSSFVIGDPAGWHKSQLSEESANDVLKRLGFKAYRAPTNDIDPRLRAVEALLVKQVQRQPMLLIDGGNCPQLVQAMKFNYRYRRKQNDQLEDKPEKTHPWSDLADCLQYMALGVQGNYSSKVISEGKARITSPRPSVASWA